MGDTLVSEFDIDVTNLRHKNILAYYERSQNASNFFSVT